MHLRKALVVDDEYAARETMCRIVDWSALGFSPPVTAGDGKRALQLFGEDTFDLVFTDIEMPVMSGIALIEEIRRLRPEQQIVVVSCHEKFEYARKALQLGVVDYLIKDLLTPNELAALLTAYSVNRPAGAPGHVRQQDGLCELLRLRVSGLSLPPGTAAPFPAMTVLAVKVDDYDQLCLSGGEEALVERISHLASRLDCPAHYYAGHDTVYLLYGMEGGNSTLYYYNSVITIANGVRGAAKKEGFAQLSIGVSNLCTDAEGLYRAGREAEEAAQMRVLTGAGRTTIYDTIALRRSSLDFQQMEYLLKCIEDFCYNANTAGLRLVDKLYEVELPTAFADIHYYRYISARLWAIVLSVAKEQGRDHTAVLRAMGVGEGEIRRMEGTAEMAGFLKDCLLHLFAEDEKPENDNLPGRVLRLIEREYTQDITLSDIAQRLHINKSYLSRMFKQKTGDSIMNYIMKKKISRAKYLLSYTHMKLYEISDNLSFASPQYFSTVFKRYVGVSPNEYKKASVPEGEEPGAGGP